MNLKPSPKQTFDGHSPPAERMVFLEPPSVHGLFIWPCLYARIYLSTRAPDAVTPNAQKGTTIVILNGMSCLEI
jgi:hypothetical protein